MRAHPATQPPPGSTGSRNPSTDAGAPHRPQPGRTDRTDRTDEWSIQEVARLAGTTSRTLRHYDAIGLLTPSRTAGSGQRFYDRQALVRLQRILVLRGLGVGLERIGEVLDRGDDLVEALGEHLAALEDQQEQVARRIRAVRATRESLRKGEGIMAEEMFDGFDHTQYRDEVVERWGKQAWQDSDRWWREASPEERADRTAQVEALNADWTAAAASGTDPAGPEARALAERHVAWLRSVPGTPAATGDPAATRAYVTGLAQMYVADPRFSANYGGRAGAEFVRDALAGWARASAD